ncbi:MAG: mechanosensitive ion channel family protein [bacterium]
MNLELVSETFYELLQYVNINFIRENLLIQIVYIGIALLLTYLLNKKVKDLIIYMSSRFDYIKEKNLGTIKSLSFLMIFTLSLWIYLLFSIAVKGPKDLIYILSNLFSAWVFIKLLISFFDDKIITRVMSILIGIIFSLKIIGIYEKVIGLLDSIAFTSGNIEISILLLLKGIIFLSISFWLARKASKFALDFLNNISEISPSLQALLSKITKFIIFTVAFLVTLSAVGFDLSALAFMGGAVGVGLGFGLQKIVSNFISGIIILVDKSVKPGDVIETGEVYGWIKSLGTRYISIITREGKEYLIPNEDLITKQVVNWSYSDNLVLVKTEINISYDSEVEEVMSLARESVKEIQRVRKKPEPNCYIKEFGDSAIVLQIRFWIDNPRRGIANVKNEVHLKIWEVFQENEIIIPYPQQDLHLKTISQDDVPRSFKEIASNKESEKEN